MFVDESEYLEKIENLQSEVEESLNHDQIVLNDQLLKSAMKDQVQLQLKWEQYFSRVSSYVRDLEQLLEEVYSKEFDKSINNKYKDVTAQQAKHSALASETYINVKIVYNEAVKLKTEIQGVVDVIKSRQFTLNKIADLVINSVDSTII